MKAMDAPVTLESLRPRDRADVLAMCIAVQANVAALRVAAARRIGVSPEEHAIRTPSPGWVRRFREVLIDRHALSALPDDALALRVHQVWGEFSALCWVVGVNDPHQPGEFAALEKTAELRCPLRIQEKLDDVQRGLWRLRFEQRLRCDPAGRGERVSQAEREAAQAMPLRVEGMDVRLCDVAALVRAACEFAGMLAALRWVADARWEWEAPGIMELGPGDQPGVPPEQ
ncbi:MAG: hypothetical protein L6Q92_15865 [Phycisphaerae bacterium]|nr:hypothetical protein [Phycisphaerae bacterium]